MLLLVGGGGDTDAFLYPLLGQFAGFVVGDFDGSCLAVDGFGGLGLSAVSVQGVLEVCQRCAVGLFVDDGCKLVGSVVAVFAGRAVGSRDLGTVAIGVVFERGFAVVGCDDFFNTVESAVGVVTGGNIGRRQ
ncbi:MAG: hypothetical protein FWC42_01665 [Proteobacteria bacterium]|nr:hypothetical protein [Pseudomonadota bacterium]